MATNGTTRKYSDLLLPIGKGADGTMAHVIIGQLLVTDWGRDKPPSWDVELFTTHLQPVLYQQVTKATGTVTVVCKKADHSKKYKSAAEVQPPGGEGVPDETAVDVGHE